MRLERFCLYSGSLRETVKYWNSEEAGEARKLYSTARLGYSIYMTLVLSRRFLFLCLQIQLPLNNTQVSVRDFSKYSNSNVQMCFDT